MSKTLIALFVLVAGPAAFIAGVVLVVRGDRIKFLRRGGECGSCGYSLRGLPRAVERCPECGTERTAGGRARWRRSDRAMTIGIVLLVVSGILLPFSLLGLAHLLGGL